MVAYLLPEGRQSFETATGGPAVGWKLYTYDAGTNTPRLTWSDEAQTAPNTNPVIMDARGEAPIYFSGNYKLVLKDQADVTIWTQDNVEAVPVDFYAATVLAPLALSSGSSLIGFIQTGANAVLRTVQSKLRDFVSNTDYSGADDSAKMQSAITAKRNVLVPSGSALVLGDLAMSNSHTIEGNGAGVTGKAAAANIANISDYAARISNIYVSGGTALSGPLFRILQSRYARLESISAVNCGPGFLDIGPASPGTEASNLAMMRGIRVEDFTATAVNVRSAVSELFATDVLMRGKLVFSGGLARVTTGTVGWRQNTPLVGPGNFARGGHELTAVNFLDCERGFYFTDSELTRLNGCGADGISDYGLLVDGATARLELFNFFNGTSRGIKVAGTSSVFFNGLTTILNGVVPPWADPLFYNGVATFFDIEVRDTATVTISGRWTGDKRIFVDPTAKLILDCGTRFYSRSASVGASTTTYITEAGGTPTEADATWRVPCAGTICGIFVAPTVAPGAGIFTYTVRKNFASTGATVSLTGAVFGGDFWVPGGNVKVAAGDVIAMQLVTNGAAPAARHNTIIYFVPD